MVVGKDDELGDIDDESLARVRLITDRKRQLEEAADQVRQDIQNCFKRIAETLHGRERQLLRQVEAIHRQQVSLVQSNSELLPAISSAAIDANLTGEEELCERLRCFGKIELANSVAVDAEPYKAEEYLEAGEDYVSFDKSLKTDAETLDVSSVLRPRRDAKGNPSKKIVSINLSCTSCETYKFETDRSPVIATTPKKLEEIAITPTTPSTSSEKSPSKESEDEACAFAETESKSPLVNEKTADVEDSYLENESSIDTSSEKIVQVEPLFDDTVESCETDETTEPCETDEITEPREPNENDASKQWDDENATVNSAQDKLKDAGGEHPKQIQQWLQQILAETETEPIIQEFDHLSRIPNTRLYCTEFPVET